MYSLGWIRQPIDERDYKSELHNTVSAMTPLPSEFKIQTPITYDQGMIGSCGANSGCLNYFNYLNNNSKANKFKPSRLFLYYSARKMEGWQNQDSGVILRDVFKSLKADGVSSETTWKYDINKFTKQPSKTAYKSAATHKINSYCAVEQNIDIIKKTLYTNSLITFGFDVYPSFMNGDWHKKTGVMPKPDTAKESLLGGHAVTIKGWNDTTKCFVIQNSWGTDWGMSGDFFMPYDIMLSPVCSDFWIIQS